MLIVFLVQSWLAYGIANLAGAHVYQYRRLFSRINTAAKLIHRCLRYDHLTPQLHNVYCL